MTSFGKKLAAEFEEEFARLANGWYLKWHAFARGELVEIDDFRGGLLRLPSKAFDSATETAYWNAIKRYASGKIDDTFARIEREVGWRSGERAVRVAEDGAIALRAFLEKLNRHAIFTAYRLQGRGYPDERYFASQRDEMAITDVQRRKVELLQRCRSTPWLRRIAFRVAGSSGPRIALLASACALLAGSTVVVRYITTL